MSRIPDQGAGPCGDDSHWGLVSDIHSPGASGVEGGGDTHRGLAGPEPVPSLLWENRSIRTAQQAVTQAFRVKSQA